MEDVLPSEKTAKKAITFADNALEGPVKDDNPPDEQIPYIVGGKLYIIVAAICLSFFLVILEISIVSTSLVPITNELAGFEKSSWVITAYLLTFTGLLIIWAKISDILGRKWPLVTSLLIFIVFSGACGAAQTMNQLIVLRAFQGIGSSGVYSLCMILIFEIVPSHKYPTYSLALAVIFTLSHSLGPLLGGVVNIHPAWRWIFLLNVPAGIIPLIFLVVSLPDRFPLHRTIEDKVGYGWFSVPAKLFRIDFLGAGLILVATTLLLTALQQATVGWQWSSPSMIVLLVLAGLLWVSLLIWEWYMSSRALSQETIFPWRFVTNRATFGAILNSFFTGCPFTVCVISIPLRFQATQGGSALEAGVRLLPFTFTCPFGSILAAPSMGKAKVPPIYLQFVGAGLQVIGIALMSRDDGTSLSAASYGYEVIAGLGVGISIISTTIIAPFLITNPVDLSLITAAVVQFRFLGGALGLAAVTNAMQTLVRRKLSTSLSVEQVAGLLQSTSVIDEFPPALQQIVKQAFGQGFGLEMKIVLGFAAAQFLATLLMWQRPPVRVK